MTRRRPSSHSGVEFAVDILASTAKAAKALSVRTGRNNPRGYGGLFRRIVITSSFVGERLP